MSVAFKPEAPFAMPEPFGKPGIKPNWARGSKQGIGTALSDQSKVWFTIADGILTETFYPTVDTANTKDMKFIVTDSKTFFDEEGVDTVTKIKYIDSKAPAYLIINTAKSGAYRIIKRIITDPSANSIVTNVIFEALKGSTEEYSLYLLFAPRIKNKGYGNFGRCADYNGRDYFFAHRENIATALTADTRFTKMSVGYSGHSDGWHDIKENYRMDWTFERADDGNIAFMGELEKQKEFNIVLSFGKDEIDAAIEANKTLSRDFDEMEKEYVKGWRHYLNGLERLSSLSADKGKLFRTSAMTMKIHEDKTFKGALITSLSVPWGEIKSDDEAFGYRLVWPRDVVKGALAFTAMGDNATAVEALNYLKNTQREDGSWPLNMWVNGTPYQEKAGLDEAAYPIILAWKLKSLGAVGHVYYPMIKSAAAFIAKNGPVSDRERWEERMGLSPSSLAVQISALVCAANWSREMGSETDADFLLTTADSWATKIEEWSFVECACAGENIPGHYLRILPNIPESLTASEQAPHAFVYSRNRPSDQPHRNGEIIDYSFLDLVRYGLRDPKDARITSSVAVADKYLKYEYPDGAAFYRFNGDGYGEKEDGSPFDGSGTGRLWPVMDGERALYEIMAGGNAELYKRSLENSANEGQLFPEQVWDREDVPDKRLFKWRGAGGATPLTWAHSEYIKALRTERDCKNSDIIDEVKARYIEDLTLLAMSIWNRNNPISIAKRGEYLRIASFGKANILWTGDNWNTKTEFPMTETGLGISYIDFKPETFATGTSLKFTFYYTDTGKWEGKDYEIRVY